MIDYPLQTKMLGIDSARVLECEKTDYQCANFAEVIEVITVLGVEFNNVNVRVDFEEIEHVKRVIEEKNSKQKNNKLILFPVHTIFWWFVEL